MTIEEQITRIKNNIADTYTALEDVGATLPDIQNSDNLADTAMTATYSSDLRGFVEGTSTALIIPDGTTEIAQYSFYYMKSLEKVWIPSSVETIETRSYQYAPFYGCSSTCVIYTPVSTKPSGWGSYWSYYSANFQLEVVYGATYEEFLAA